MVVDRPFGVVLPGARYVWGGDVLVRLVAGLLVLRVEGWTPWGSA